MGSTELTSVEITAASKLHMAPKHFSSSSRSGTLCSCKKKKNTKQFIRSNHAPDEGLPKGERHNWSEVPAAGKATAPPWVTLNPVLSSGSDPAVPDES